MTTENAATTDTAAAVAEQGATVAPEKASSKKAASAKKGAPKRQNIAKGGKPKAPRTAKPKKATPARKAAKAPKKAPKPKATGVREGSKTPPSWHCCSGPRVPPSPRSWLTLHTAPRSHDERHSRLFGPSLVVSLLCLRVVDWGRGPRKDTRLCHCTDGRAEAPRRARPSPDQRKCPAASPSRQASASLFPVIVLNASSDRDLWRCGRSWGHGMVSHNRAQSRASSSCQRWPDRYDDRVTDQSRQLRMAASAWGVAESAPRVFWSFLRESEYGPKSDPF